MPSPSNHLVRSAIATSALLASAGCVDVHSGSVSQTESACQSQDELNAIAAAIQSTQEAEVPNNECFSGVCYPQEFLLGDIVITTAPYVQQYGDLGSLTDKDGNVWTLQAGQSWQGNNPDWWWGGLALNGNQLWGGYNIALRLVNGDVWVEEAKQGGWFDATVLNEANIYAWPHAYGGDPGPGENSCGDGGNGTVITPGVGSFTDAAGNTYAIDPSGNAMENGSPIRGGGGTSSMEYWNGAVYGQDASSGDWYVWNGSDWTPSAAPV